MEMALIFWLLCGVFSAVLTVSLGRSAAWFLVGFLFGPFGLLVAAMPRVDKTDGQQPVIRDADPGPKRLKSAYDRQQEALRKTVGETVEVDDLPPNIAGLRAERENRRRDSEDAMVDALVGWGDSR